MHSSPHLSPPPARVLKIGHLLHPSRFPRHPAQYHVHPYPKSFSWDSLRDPAGGWPASLPHPPSTRFCASFFFGVEKRPNCPKEAFAPDMPDLLRRFLEMDLKKRVGSTWYTEDMVVECSVCRGTRCYTRERRITKTAASPARRCQLWPQSLPCLCWLVAHLTGRTTTIGGGCSLSPLTN